MKTLWNNFLFQFSAFLIRFWRSGSHLLIIISLGAALLVLLVHHLVRQFSLLKIFISIERSSSLSSKRSMMIDRYPGSKYTESFPGDMFVSPPSHSGSALSVANDHPDYKVCQYPVTITHHSLITFQYLGRSLSTGLGPDSDRGYESYRTGTCSVHGTLKRHISSGIDTTMEEDMFDDYSAGVCDKPGSSAFPFPTASIRARSRAGSLSSPSGPPPPRLGVSGLYTDHLERRKYSAPPSVSPPVSDVVNNVATVVGDFQWATAFISKLDRMRHDLTRLDKKRQVLFLSACVKARANTNNSRLEVNGICWAKMNAYSVHSIMKYFQYPSLLSIYCVLLPILTVFSCLRWFRLPRLQWTPRPWAGSISFTRSRRRASRWGVRASVRCIYIQSQTPDRTLSLTQCWMFSKYRNCHSSPSARQCSLFHQI